MFLTYGVESLLGKWSDINVHFAIITDHVLGKAGLQGLVHKTTIVILILVIEEVCFYKFFLTNSRSWVDNNSKIFIIILLALSLYPYGYLYLEANQADLIVSEHVFHQSVAFLIIVSIVILRYLTKLTAYRYYRNSLDNLVVNSKEK